MSDNNSEEKQEKIVIVGAGDPGIRQIAKLLKDELGKDRVVVGSVDCVRDKSTPLGPDMIQCLLPRKKGMANRANHRAGWQKKKKGRSDFCP